MTDKMLGHVAKDLVRDQVLTEGFRVFKDLGLKFNDEQKEIMNNYLDSLLEENILSLNDDILIPEEVSGYVNNLLGMVLGLTITSFINWGISLFYRYNYEE